MEIKETFITKVTHRCDVFVLGGGVAGIAAAAAAARQGKKVLLAERGFLLGGLATAGLITIYLPLCDGYGHQVSFGLAEELLRLSIEIAHDEKRGYQNWIAEQDPSRRTGRNPRFEVNFNPQLFAISTEQFLLALGVEILYGTTAVACVAENGAISAAIIENKSGRQAIAADAFVDASGDADLAFFAGAPTETFRQGNLLAAWYYSAGKDGYVCHPLGVADIPDEEKKEGKSEVQTLVNRRFSGLNGKEISELTILSHHAIIEDVKKKRLRDQTFEPATIPTIPQLRMTRRIAGEYSLATEEMHARFEDSIGMVSDWRKRGPVYEVPFRTLYSCKIKNLICAGRCTSVTEGMWDVMRVIPCRAVTGQAAGTAAAMFDDFSHADISALQNALKADGVILHEHDLPDASKSNGNPT